MIWSQKVIDLAGQNFDVLGVHNYEYEAENFETGLRRIRDYLSKLRDYVRFGAPTDRDRSPGVEPLPHL
jgi:alpha-L-arabinofuranosidase